LNPGPPEYEPGVLTTRLRRSVRWILGRQVVRMEGDGPGPDRIQLRSFLLVFISTVHLTELYTYTVHTVAIILLPLRVLHPVMVFTKLIW
jgi:hypothetical protein